MPDQQGADDKKTTKEVVNKKQKQMMGEEGYDVARDEGRVSPAKDKKDATTAPRKGMTAKERKKAMQQAQQRSQIAVNNVVTALRKKYGKDAVMYTQKTSKAKSNEELDLTQVAEAFGGHVIDENILSGFGKKVRKITKQFSDPLKKTLDQIKKAPEGYGSQKGMSTKARKTVSADPDAKVPGKKNIYRPSLEPATFDPEGEFDTGVAPGEKPGKVTKYKIGDKPPESKVEKARKAALDRKLQKDVVARSEGPQGRGRKPKGSTYRKKFSDTIRAKKQLKTDKLIKSVKSTPQKAVSASQRIGRAVGTPLTKASDATKAVGSTAQGLGKIANQSVVQPSFQALRQSKLGKSGATIADMGKTAVGKVKSGLSVGGLKTAGTRAGKKLFGKGGALAAKTIGRAGAKFGAKRIYGVGSAIAGAEAIGRFASGDIVGGTLAGAEAITGLIPGLGTGVSAGLGALGLARDLKRTKGVVSAVRKAKNLRKFKPVTRGLVGKKSNLNRFVKGAVKPQNRTSTAVGLTGAGVVGSNVSDRRRNRLRLPSIPSPTLTGGSAGFRTAG